MTVTLSAPGFANRSILVHVVRTLYMLTLTAGNPAPGDSVGVYIRAVIPGQQPALYTVARQSKTGPAFLLQTSDPAIVKVGTPAFSPQYSFYYPDVTAVAVGTATLTLTSPSGALIDPQSAKLTVTVALRVNSLPGNASIVLGKDLQVLLSPYYNSPAAGRIFRSSDPSRVLLSHSPQLAGTDHVDDSGPVYVQALADSGDVPVVTTGGGYADWITHVVLCPTGLGFLDQSNTGPVLTGTAGTTFTLQVAPLPIDALSGNPIPGSGYSLRGGIDPFEAKISSTDSSVGSVFSPVGFTAGMSQSTTTFTADANGTTELSVQAPAGFVDAGPALHRRIQIGASKLSLGNISLGKNLMYYYPVGGVGNSTPGVIITVTSSDPSKLLVSDSPKSVGQASATITGSTVFYAQAVDDNGDVTVTVSAPGFDSAAATVHLEPSYFSFGRGGTSFPSNVDYLSTYSTSVYLLHPGNNFLSNESLRPGAGPVTVPITVSDPSIVSVNAPVVLNEGYQYTTVIFAALGLGTVKVEAGAPAGYILGPEADRLLTLNANSRTFSAYIGDLEKDRTAALNAFPSLPAPVNYAVVSADPSLLLFSLDANTPGSAQLSFPADPKTPTTVWVQALGDSGTAAYTISAPGFQTFDGKVQLHPSGFMFQNQFGPLTLKAGGTASVQVMTDTVQPIRPGASPITVRIDNSDPTVATATPVTFRAGDRSQSMVVTAKGPGTAVFTIRDTSGTSSSINLVVNVPVN